MIDVRVAFAEASRMSLKDWATVVQAAATSIGILVGGLWTYFLFVRKRQRFPRANISHQVFYKRISEGKALLNVETVITNSGDVLLCLESGFVRVQQILPIPEAIGSTIEQGRDPVAEDGREVDWPLLSTRTFTWAKGKAEVEPGEIDRLVSDHLIDADVRVVSVYSYVKNTKKGKRDIGWGITTIYDVDSEMDQIEEKGGDKEDE